MTGRDPDDYLSDTPDADQLAQAVTEALQQRDPDRALAGIAHALVETMKQLERRLLKLEIFAGEDGAGRTPES